MEQQTKEIMEDALASQHEVHAMYELYQASLQEENSFGDWLYYIIDTADVSAEENDFKDENDVIDYPAYYRAVYNQVKAFIKAKVNYAIDNWIQTDQPIES